jgi:hypothetical protein
VFPLSRVQISAYYVAGHALQYLIVEVPDIELMPGIDPQLLVIIKRNQWVI